jgi:hypothetical protein
VVDIATQITEKTAKELKSARVVRLLPSNNWDRRVNNACEAERLVIFEALDKPYWLNCTNPHTKTVVYCPTTMKHFPTMLPKKTTEAFIVLPHDFGANGPTTWLSLLESLDDAEGAQEVSRPVVSFLKSLGALKGYWDNPDNQQIIHDKLPPPPPTGAETWLRLMDVISMWHKRVKCIIVVGINELPPERFGIHPGAEPRHRSSGKGSYTPFFDLAAQHSSSRRHDVADYLKTYSNVRFVPLSQYNNKNPYDLDFRSA